MTIEAGTIYLCCTNLVFNGKINVLLHVNILKQNDLVFISFIHLLAKMLLGNDLKEWVSLVEEVQWFVKKLVKVYMN